MRKPLIPLSALSSEKQHIDITAQMYAIMPARPKFEELKCRICRKPEIEVHPLEMGYVHLTGLLKWVEGDLHFISSLK